MRVLFCKVHCPLTCFCKPSSHLYNPSSLKLENTTPADGSPPPPLPPPHVPPSPAADNLEDPQTHADGNGNCNDIVNQLKSSLRKPSSPESSPVEKKRVQWVDVLGKELAEIKEFESSEDGDLDYGRMDNRGCVCTIL